jgi:thioredoxin reductase
MHDVIVIGGSFAGMAAALQLLRARRKVLVVDAGERRNRFASTSHGFLGQDGVDPAVIWARARDQVLAYPTLTWVTGKAMSVTGQRDGFSVVTEVGAHGSRRLLLAIGLRDDLPAIPGLAERWGQSVFHCPYCHGYELNQGKIGVIATGPMSLHQAQMLSDWGATTFLTNSALVLDADQRNNLRSRGVMVEETPITALIGAADIQLKDGRTLTFAGLFTASRTSPASPLAGAMGCAMMETPLGVQISTSESKETSVPGVFACGDAARAPHSVSLAVADGAWAGAQVHRSLLFP